MWYLTPDQRQKLVRLGVSVLIGFLVGLYRHHRGKLAGVRTHAMVCLGSAVVMLGATRAFPHARVPLAIQGGVSGVGFIGAGLIEEGRNS